MMAFTASPQNFSSERCFSCNRESCTLLECFAVYDNGGSVLGHSNWIISFPLLDVTTGMRVGGLLLLSSYYLPDI